jgi:hypothetical protein
MVRQPVSHYSGLCWILQEFMVDKYAFRQVFLSVFVFLCQYFSAPITVRRRIGEAW